MRDNTMALRLHDATEYLDIDALQSIDTDGFRDARPFPWINPDGLILDDRYRELIESLPEPTSFKSTFGRRRRHGQTSHDRLTLNYNNKLDLPAPWSIFVNELQGPVYRGTIQRLLGVDDVDLTFHWHYTPNGCSLSPHCDAEWKLGSHIFYLNTAADWDPAWGGQTLILDDDGAFSHKSAPRIEDFKAVIPAKAMGNNSLLFQRTDHSWHGMYPLANPESMLRKVFIVEFRKTDIATRLRTLFR